MSGSQALDANAAMLLSQPQVYNLTVGGCLTNRSLFA